MTTIAWDGHSLVADRQMTCFTTPVQTTKIYRINREGQSFLIGASGDKAECQAYIDWAHGLRDKPVIDKEVSIICIDEDKKIWIAHKELNWYQVEADCWAIGSGCDYALGALKAGKSAIEAVEIASQLDVNTGMGFDCLSLDVHDLFGKVILTRNDSYFAGDWVTPYSL